MHDIALRPRPLGHGSAWWNERGSAAPWAAHDGVAHGHERVPPMAQLGRCARGAAIALVTPLALAFLAGCNNDDDSPTGTGSSTRIVFSSDRNSTDESLELYSTNADGSDV